MARDLVNLLDLASWSNYAGVTIGPDSFTFPVSGNYSTEYAARMDLDMGWDSEPILAGDTVVGTVEYTLDLVPEDNVWFTLYNEYTGIVYFQQQIYDDPDGTLGMSGSFDIDVTIPEPLESLIFRIARGPDGDAQYAPYGYDVWGTLTLSPPAGPPPEPVCFWTDIIGATQICQTPVPPPELVSSFYGAAPTTGNGSGGFLLAAPYWSVAPPNLIQDALAAEIDVVVLRHTTDFSTDMEWNIVAHDLQPVAAPLTANYSSGSFGTGVSPNLHGGYTASMAAGLSNSLDNLIEVDFNPGGEPLIAYGIVYISFPA